MCTADKSKNKQNSKYFPLSQPKTYFCGYFEPYSDIPTYGTFAQAREDSAP